MKKTYQILAVCTGMFLFSCSGGDKAATTEAAPEAATEAPAAEAPEYSVVINTPDDALNELKAGNQRFLDGKLVNTNYTKQIDATKGGQTPHTVILSCLDSRIPPEILFDQGIGNMFVARTAGNIEDPNNVGSMEFATKLMGTKLIVVMGHNHCGAVEGAIANAELGNLTQLLDQIKPAIVGGSDAAKTEASFDNSDGYPKETDLAKKVDDTARNNVKVTIEDILKKSSVISDLVKEGKVKIVGAYYDLTTGKVEFL